MTDEDKVGELLLEWQRLQEWGQDVSPSVLCGDRPDLVPLLTERIALLRWMDPTPDEPNTPEPRTEPQPLEPESRPTVPKNLQSGRIVVSARSMSYIICCIFWFGGAAMMVAGQENVLAPQFVGIGFVVCFVVTVLAGIVAEAGSPPETGAKNQSDQRR